MTTLISILVYLFIGWLTVPITLIFPESEYEITIGDLFKFTELEWYVTVFLWPVAWIIILIELCKKISECDIVIWRKKK